MFHILFLDHFYNDRDIEGVFLPYVSVHQMLLRFWGEWKLKNWKYIFTCATFVKIIFFDFFEFL